MFAEFEFSLRRERQLEGIAAAKARGVYRGRKPSGRIARILFCLSGGRMVLLHAFIKKSQKTPDRELNIAVKRMKGEEMIDEKHIGSSLEDFLREEGRLEEARQVAAKRVLARQLRQSMEDQHLNTVDMAERMQTSRSQLDRLLDLDNDKVQLDTLNRAAAIVGKRLEIELVDIPR